MKIESRLSNIIFLFIPTLILLIFEKGFLYVNIYLFVFILLKIGISIKGINKKSSVLISFFFLAVIIQIQHLLSRDFISFVFLLMVAYCTISNNYIKNTKSLKYCLALILGITILTLFGFIFAGLFSNDEGRFHSWSGSPTTMCFYCISLFYIGINIFEIKNKRKIKLALLFSLLFVIILLSGTRSALILFALIFIAYFGVFNKLINKKVIVCLFVIALLLMSVFNDLLYDTLYDLGLNQFTGRYADGTDYSYLTRLELKIKLLTLIREASFFQVLFGRGSGYTVGYLSHLEDLKILAHNDFLKIIIDWGIVFTFLFLSSLVHLFLKVRNAIIPLAIYVLSFYHNMMFDSYNIVLIFAIFYICSIKKKNGTIKLENNNK
jgi:hypothetical protein